MPRTKKTQEAVGSVLQDKLVGLTTVNAPVPLSTAVLEQQLSPGAGSSHFLPRDEQLEGKLNEVEKLIRRGSYNAAIREAGKVSFAESDQASTYALLLNEKVARSQVALGDRFLAKGDTAQARRSYTAAIRAAGADAKTRAVADLTMAAASRLSEQRKSLIGTLVGISLDAQYERWCETRGLIQSTSIFDHIATLVPDVSFEDLLGPRVPPPWPPKGDPTKGWIDPPPIDELAANQGVLGAVLDRPTLLPGSTFASLSARPISLTALNGSATGATNGPVAASQLQLRASSTLPLMSSMLQGHARLLALETGLNLVGRSRGSIPIYRYSYLLEQARQILTFVMDIDARMSPMQIKLDDFAAAIGPVQGHINSDAAAIQALDTRIADLQTTLSALSATEGEVRKVRLALEQAEDDCDPEWWEYLVSVVVVIAATAVGAAIGLLIGGIPGAIAGGAVALGTSIGLTIQVWSDRLINCENVTAAREDFQSAESRLHAAVNDMSAELNHALSQRDILIVELAALQQALNQLKEADAQRMLNGPTLSHILDVLDGARNSAIGRAHALARMAQDAYNFENDTQVNNIASSASVYLDKSAHGYTAATVLQRDLDGLEHIRLTGRASKRMQLVQTVSLLKHYPSSFGSILTSGHARFATRMADFDRWFPGTYMQSLKEVQVEVLVDGEPRPIRGYLTNDGTSIVRFVDHGNKVELDGSNVIAEPDVDLRKLCFKRRRRHHTVETMAFPTSPSFLYAARATETQNQERNFFEGCGLESTWHLELMTDQQLDYARITDVYIHFQFEALFDSALKQVVEGKRYKGRDETAIISVRKLFEEKGAPVDFSQPLELPFTSFRLEAPHLQKKIRDVGVILRPNQAPLLDGKATLRINYQNQAAVEVETNEQGIVATAGGNPAGTNTAALGALTAGKSTAGVWSVEIVDLPVGFQVADINDILIMVRYTFDAA